MMLKLIQNADSRLLVKATLFGFSHYCFEIRILDCRAALSKTVTCVSGCTLVIQDIHYWFDSRMILNSMSWKFVDRISIANLMTSRSKNLRDQLFQKIFMKLFNCNMISISIILYSVKCFFTFNRAIDIKYY